MVRKLKIQRENDKTFKDGFEEFIDSCKARNLRPATINHYQESYKSITRFLDEQMLIKDIKQSTVDNFVRDCKDKLDISSQTLFTYTRDLKTILYYFMRMEYMKEFKIKLPQVDKKAIETYTDAELKILLKKPDLKNCSFVTYRDWTLINFLMSTALRLNSFINIRIRDLDFENEVVYVNTTKNRKPLIVPLNKTIIKILKEYLKVRQYKDENDYLFCNVYGNQLNKKTINGSLIRYNRERGVTTTGIHRYRHSAVKRLVLANMNPVFIQKLLGHSSLLITQNYINILVSDLKQEMKGFDILEQFNNGYIKISRGR
ncbi:phage integrase family protein [Clostridium sp. YIM B02505]|uniref:Phage integrase family protein n=1 Tax=Clostridium yunnanense TaxID=2800325 RepID=A0ABS1EIH8_9CLOT|nr:site-specific integrase [Clostridium yunnanense]MBK1809172.1 phage integrase family protein [Clostridium yunnanense]